VFDNHRKAIRAVIAVVVSIFLAVIIGLIGTTLGLSTALSTGAAVVAMFIALLSGLGLGFSGGAGSDGETNVTIDGPVSVKESQKEKETSPDRADYPERSARIFRALSDRGLDYSTLRTTLMGLFILSFSALALLSISFGTRLTAEYGSIQPLPLFETITDVIIPLVGTDWLFQATMVAFAITMFVVAALVELSDRYQKTTCSDCDQDFCMSFNYVLYNPNAREK